jgi:hypothetical protein
MSVTSVQLKQQARSADRAWDALADLGMVDSRDGAEYRRRIASLRDWLLDPNGGPLTPAELRERQEAADVTEHDVKNMP